MGVPRTGDWCDASFRIRCVQFSIVLGRTWKSGPCAFSEAPPQTHEARDPFSQYC